MKNVLMAMLLLALVPTASGNQAIYVSNTAELLSAMQNAHGGDEILCRPGIYTALQATQIRKTGRVIIRAADRNHPPVFREHNSFILRELENFTFDGIHFDGSTLKDDFGYPKGRAIRYAYCKNITFRNCLFDFWHIGIDQVNEKGNLNENIVMEYNRFTRRGMDAIRAFHPHVGLSIRNNVFDNDYIDTTRSRQSDRHPDCIQFAANEPWSLASKDVVIENNQFDIADLYSHCMFLMSGAVIKKPTQTAPAQGYYFERILIRNNDIVAAHVNAIAVGGMHGVTIEGNRLRKTPGNYYLKDPRGWPRINVYGYCTGIIRNNTGPYSQNAQRAGALDQMVDEGNNTWNAASVPAGWVGLTGRVGPYAYETANDQQTNKTR